MTAVDRGGAEVEIRPVRDEECDPLGELLVRAYRAVPGAQEEPAYWDRMRDVRGRSRRASVLAAVSEAGRLLGGVTYVDGRSEHAELPGPGEAEMRMLGVAPRDQGRGIGTMLVRACVERASAAARSRLWIATTPWMARAQHLYDALGFEREPERDFTYTDPVSGEVLELRASALRIVSSRRAAGTGPRPAPRDPRSGIPGERGR